MNRILIVLIMAGAAEAHSGDRVYPFYKLTDEMLELIDLHDGLIDEWYRIGEPSMTLLDFRTVLDIYPPDPSNFDFRIWLAWHDETNRIYVSIIVIDDDYKDTPDWDIPILLYNENDSIWFVLDADHSGGKGHWNGTPVEDYPEIFGRTQWYGAVSQTENGQNLDDNRGNVPTEASDSWRISPPYGDAGGAVAGENPTVWTIEMYVTPQDRWGDSIETTLFSELSANQVIGFGLIVIDNDPTKGDDHDVAWNPEAIGDRSEGRPSNFLLARGDADILLDGLLLPAQDTAVESVSWGRIKASLE